ncbi:exodeoxyribonuclease III [Rhodobacteraceae bacterium CH30]|nr:exodeoxyribonuclease III [Rhodobacteraceae bacterium CH30]
MLRIVSANLNGIRSADKKGFFDWMAKQEADFVCVQELKAQAADLSARMQAADGMQGYFHYAEKKGYSGVGVYTRRTPDAVIEGLGIDWIDREGRYLQLDFGQLSVISLYLPSGSSSDERQQVKFDFLAVFLPHLESLYASGRDVVICGDWNIAHNEIDLKNWKGNLKNSGFLPEERAWIGDLFQRVGWADVWRTLYPQAPGYSWWSNRGQAYAKDVGWRIDYQIATPALMACAQNGHVYKDEKFSDHAPLIIDYDYPT